MAPAMGQPMASAMGVSPLLNSMVRPIVDGWSRTYAATAATSSRLTVPGGGSLPRLDPPRARLVGQAARSEDRPVEPGGAKVVVRGGLGVGVREERAVLRHTVIRVGVEVGHHEVAPRPGGLRGGHGPDRRVAVHGIRPGGVASAGSGGPDHRVVPAEMGRHLLDAQVLGVGDQGGGAGGLDLRRVVGVAHPGRHVVPGGAQKGAETPGDLAVPADDRDLCHAGHPRRCQTPARPGPMFPLIGPGPAAPRTHRLHHGAPRP